MVSAALSGTPVSCLSILLCSIYPLPAVLRHELPGSLFRDTVLIVHYPGNPLPRSTLWQPHTPPEPILWVFFFFFAAGTAHQQNPGEGRILPWYLVVQACLPWALLLEDVCSLWYSGALSTCCQLFALWGTKMPWKEKELVVNCLSLQDV